MDTVAKKSKVGKKSKAKVSATALVRGERNKQFTMWLTLKERKRLQRRAEGRGFESTSDYVRMRVGLKPLNPPKRGAAASAE